MLFRSFNVYHQGAGGGRKSARNSASENIEVDASKNATSAMVYIFGGVAGKLDVSVIK